MEDKGGTKFVRIDRSNTSVLDVVADDVFDDDIDGELLQAVLENGQLLVVATVGGVVVGQVQAMIQHHVDGPSQLYIDNLGVSPLHQRQGTARGLVHDVTGWAGELGCKEAWIVAESDNRQADAFYRSLDAHRSTVALYSLDL